MYSFILFVFLSFVGQLLDWSFNQVCICWEDMILEMDAKFTKYARERLKQNKVSESNPETVI